MSNKAYRENHREELRIKQRAWRDANKEHHRAYQRKYNKEHPNRHKKELWSLSRKYAYLKSHAKSYNFDCLLSFEEYKILINSSCYYCGGFLPQTGSGVDRINSSVGYIIGNVRPCCKNCNRAKNNLTENEFKEWILKIFNHWINREQRK